MHECRYKSKLQHDTTVVRLASLISSAILQCSCKGNGHRSDTYFSSYLGVESRSLSEEGTGDEPETVGHGELILHYVRFCEARMRVVPLVGRETSHDEQSEADQQVGCQDVDPYFRCQRVHETEESSGLTGWHLNKWLESVNPAASPSRKWVILCLYLRGVSPSDYTYRASPLR